MNLQLKTKIESPEFLETLIKNLNGIGVTTSSIQAIYLCGSALYIDSPNDVDLKIMVRSINPKAEILRNFNILGVEVQPHLYTFRDWKRVREYKLATFIAESSDMLLIYGSEDNRFFKHDVTVDVEAQAYLLNIYDRYLFNYKKENKETYEFKPKRLWNFLLFAFKVLNASNTLTPEQIVELNKAHNKEVTLEEYRPLFEEIKSRIN